MHDDLDDEKKEHLKKEHNERKKKHDNLDDNKRGQQKKQGKVWQPRW